MLMILLSQPLNAGATLTDSSSSSFVVLPVSESHVAQAGLNA